MKIKWLILLLVVISRSSAVAQTVINLNTGWIFNQTGKTEKMKASVPGCVQADLLNLKKIPDPFTALNEEKIAWVEQAGWQYHRVLEIAPATLKKERIVLVFEGLDTYAEVLLNGRSVLKAGNMFRTWKIDVKPFLKAGSNTLQINFASVPATATPMANASAIKYPADNEQGSVKISPFVRKAAFQFGWDFAPRLLTAGIWKPVYLETWDRATITDLQVVVAQFNPKRARCFAVAEVEATKAGNYRLRITDKKTGKPFWETTKDLRKGMNRIEQEFTLPHPQFWWPNGLGTPYLYNLSFKLSSDGGFKCEKTTTFGVRNIEVVNKPDSIGQSFYVRINEKPVFIKGANFVPVSSLNQAANSKKLKQLFADMKESHFNMIRVWGGGYYESDEFYRLADENGIMVWQDFPFACTMYPSDPAFLENVKQEAIDNIKRIRNHPSLALWCGNNEVAVGWQNWGWQKTYGYSKADSLELINGYNKLFKQLLPQLVSEYDKNRFYFHSSPISNWGKPEDFKSGDNHYWGVYHGEAPFSAYETHIPRFNSEFGFQSFPSWQTLKEITQTGSPKLDGEVLTKRQKSYKGNKLLAKYMDWYYQPPATDEEFVYLSQLQQAEGMKTAIEASRSSTQNMGTLVWQLNDVWPAISWSAIEYNGQWKATQYFIKKAYEPVLLTIKEEKDRLVFFIVNDVKGGFDGNLVIKKWSVEGKTKPFDTVLHVSGNILSLSRSALKITDRSREFITASLVDGNAAIAEKIFYFNPVKDLVLPDVKVAHQLINDGKENFILLKSDQLVKNIYLSIDGTSAYHFADNYFDMLPGKEYKIKLTSRLTTAFIRQNLKIRFVKNQKK